METGPGQEVEKTWLDWEMERVKDSMFAAVENWGRVVVRSGIKNSDLFNYALYSNSTSIHNVCRNVWHRLARETDVVANWLKVEPGISSLDAGPMVGDVKDLEAGLRSGLKMKALPLEEVRTQSIENTGYYPMERLIDLTVYQGFSGGFDGMTLASFVVGAYSPDVGQKAAVWDSLGHEIIHDDNTGYSMAKIQGFDSKRIQRLLKEKPGYRGGSFFESILRLEQYLYLRCPEYIFLAEALSDTASAELGGWDGCGKGTTGDFNPENKGTRFEQYNRVFDLPEETKSALEKRVHALSALGMNASFLSEMLRNTVTEEYLQSGGRFDKPDKISEFVTEKYLEGLLNDTIEHRMFLVGGEHEIVDEKTIDRLDYLFRWKARARFLNTVSIVCEEMSKGMTEEKKISSL